MLYVMLRCQATYYVVTGLWPLISMESFEFVTGPKTDDWLVYMVGLLAVAIGLGLWFGAGPMRPVGAVVILAAASAVSFTAIDLRYTLTGQIGKIYLLDAALEVGFLLALLVGLRAAATSRGDVASRNALRANVKVGGPERITRP